MASPTLFRRASAGVRALHWPKPTMTRGQRKHHRCHGYGKSSDKQRHYDMIQIKLVDRTGGPARGWGHLRTGPNHDKGGPRSWLRLVYRRTGDRDVIEITKCSKAGQRRHLRHALHWP